METPKITNETIIRIIVLAVALVNQTLTSLGKNPIPIMDSQIGEAATLALTVFASVWAWWKDNDITRKARERKSMIKN